MGATKTCKTRWCIRLRGHENRFLPSQKVCVAGNIVQERSGRVSLARTVLCWAHITFKSLLRRLRMKSLVTMASHTNRSLHVCRFSCEPKKHWWMQTEKNKYSRESPDTDVIWASPCGDKTRKQAQNGGGAFSIGYVLSSWRFHGITYTLGAARINQWTAPYHRFFSRVPRESSVWAEGQAKSTPGFIKYCRSD